MSTVWPSKKKDKIARAKVLNKRTPQAIDQFKTDMKTLLMGRLYRKQFTHWNSELQKLSYENALSQGRSDDGLPYAIYWNHKRYAPVQSLFADPEERAYCIPLNPRIKEYADRMEIIAEELDELWEEKYEAERFISNLFTFQAPPDRFKQILGATLFRVVEEHVRRFYDDCDDSWEDNSEFGLRTFVEANMRVIETMNERIMINLVTI